MFYVQLKSQVRFSLTLFSQRALFCHINSKVNEMDPTNAILADYVSLRYNF